MLRIISGRAGAGKTLYFMDDIRRRMDAGETGMLLIVPEQYSHDAERQLCAVCGDRLSLHAETLSFTRLCSHVFYETGGALGRSLDASGQILSVYKALESVVTGLRVFGIRKMRTEILEKLFDAVKEFKSLNITPQELAITAERAASPLSDKLRDLALIYDAYDALLQVHGNDAADRLTRLAERIGESSVGSKGHIYFDGFNDFTTQELCIIGELLCKGAQVTVCLTYDSDEDNEIFEIPRKTAAVLQRLAMSNKVESQSTILQVAEPKTTEPKTTEPQTPESQTAKPQTVEPQTAELQTTKPQTAGIFENTAQRVSELTFLEKHLFDDNPARYPEESTAITIYTAPIRYVECQHAAFCVLELVRKNGYRWRDIAVMARNWEEYSSICENVFEKYSIPYFTSGKADVMSKPPLTLIDAALEIATSGWEYNSIFRYLKTGLTVINSEQCAILENYALKWKIRGSLWTREWLMPPSGYGRAKENDNEVLEQLNALRLQAIQPLMNLRDGLKGESSVEVKLRALFHFLEEIKLPERLAKKADEFNMRGEKRLADEYTQLWDITINSMEQMHSILSSDNLTPIEFRKLFTLALSQNDVGVIPVSLDRTALGGMAMNRRRDLKCLIILGATDDNLPALGKNSGALSDTERRLLRELGVDIPAGFEERYFREMNMLYSTLTLPSKKLVFIYSASGGRRPAFIVKRLREMFGVSEITLSEDEYMTVAEVPYQEFLLSKGQRPEARTLLSKQKAELLYGQDFSLSATRVDRYYSCPYKHFMQNGLRLEPRMPAEFDALTAGNFMHYVLDGVFNEIKSGYGFKDVTDEFCLKLTANYIDKYEKEILHGFEGKNARFRHLFKRHCADVNHVVRDMVEELKRSDFEPLDLELDISRFSGAQSGFIDRVDGFKHAGRLYLRVIDYKTRKKAYSFDLSDVFHGRDMQLLIYLYALQKYAGQWYSSQIEPAGVLYVPARDVLVNSPRNATEEEIQKLRIAEKRRNGLVLNEPVVIEAMESGETKEFLPVKTAKDGSLTGDSLVSSEQLVLLENHVTKMMESAKENIQNGDTKCNPYYKSEVDNACNYCDYRAVCNFDEELGDKKNYINKMKPEEVWDKLKL